MWYRELYLKESEAGESATSPELQAWIREVMRRSTRRGRGTDGLSREHLETEVRRRIGGERLDFKRVRGYRTDRRSPPVSRRLICALAEVCGAPAEEGLRLFAQAVAATLPGTAPETGRVRMCGRHEEFDVCCQAIAKGQADRRLTTILVVGGPGVGKTLMMESLDAHLVDPPRAETVRISAAAGLDDLETMLGGWSGPNRARPGGLSPEEFAEELARRADAMRDALVNRATRRATVVLIDDLHYAAGPLIDLLRRLADCDLEASLAVVATYRPDPRVEAGLAHARFTTFVELGPLDIDGIEEMVRHSGRGLSSSESAALAATVFDSTQGHPAGAAMVIADHLDGQGWRAGKNLVTARESAQQSTLERWRLRLSGLPERTRTALAAGAVVGTAFDLRLIRPLPFLRDVGDRVAESLDPAIDAGVVRWLADGRLREGMRYEFSHELARDAVLSLTRPPLREEISHQVADVLASPVGNVVHPDPAARVAALFRHLREALPGYPDEAVALAEAALAHGRTLIEGLDDPGARDALEAGLMALRELAPRSHPAVEAALLRWIAICPSMGADGRRHAIAEALELLLSAPEADASMLVEVTCDYAHLSGFGARYDPDARAKCEQVLRIVSATGAHPGLVARIEATVAFHNVWCIHDDPSDALARAHELSVSAWAHAQESGDPAAKLAALDVLGCLLHLSADVQGMTDVGRQMRGLGARMSIYELLGLARQADREEFERVLSLGESTEGYPWPEGWTHQALLLQFQSLRAFLAGDLVEAVNAAKEIVDRYHEHDANFSQVYAIAFLWAAYQMVGAEPARAMAMAAADEQPGVPGYRATAAFLLARSGDCDAAERMLDDLLGEGLHGVRQDASWSVLLAVLAETIALTGAVRHAAEIYEALLPYSGQALVLATGVFCYGAADRFLGMLAPMVVDGGLDVAKACFERGLQVEQRLGAPALKSRSLLWFGRTLAGWGNADDLVWAVDILADAAAECPPQLCELLEWIGQERSILTSRRPATARPIKVSTRLPD
jgi:hypothetical protein